MGPGRSRRDFLHLPGASLRVPLIRPPGRATLPGPSSPVGIAHCRGNDPEAVLRGLEPAGVRSARFVAKLANDRADFTHNSPMVRGIAIRLYPGVVLDRSPPVDYY